MKSSALGVVVLSTLMALPLPLIAQGADSCTAESVTLIGDRALTVNPDTSNASREIVLHSSCEKDATGLVIVTDFVSDTTKSPLRSEATVSLQTNGSWQRINHVTVPPKQDLVLKLDVANLWETGRSRAKISFDGHELGDLIAFNYRLPFPITLATSTPVTITKSEPLYLILTNGGARTYPISWTFGTTSDERVGNKDLLSPNADTEILITPRDSWFESSFERFFRPAERTALLTLSVQDPTGEVRPDLPRKTLSVPVKLESYSPTARVVVSNFTTLALLVLGAVCSLLVSNWVPNRLRRVGLQQRIHKLAIGTREVSDRIASLLRVRLRVQRNQESERLEKVWTWSPNFETVAAEVAHAVDDLSARVELTGQIDQLISRLYAHRDVPVSMVDRCLEDFGPTVEALAKPDLSAATLDEIRKQIAAVGMRLTSARDAQPAFAQDLFKRWQSVNATLNGPVKSSSLFHPTQAPLQALAATVTTLQFATPDDIDPATYCKLDLELSRLEALLEAYEIHDSRSPAQQAHMTGKHAKNGTRSFIEILEEDYVATGTPASVRSAKLLVDQMKADVYADDIVTALRGPNADACQPKIVIDPPLPITDEAITFSLQFPQGAWTDSAALRKLHCEWSFGDNLTERGWIVNHYFPIAKEHTVTATIFDLEGTPILVAKPSAERKLNVQKRRSDRWVSGRTRTEIVYMLVALGAAIAALVSGAKQSLLQLDFAMGLVAVFLVGFGADSVKNVLTNSKARTP